MKKLFTLFALIGLLSFGTSNMSYASVEANDTTPQAVSSVEENVPAAKEEAPKTAAALRLMLNMKRLDLSGVDLDIAASEYEQMRIDMRPAIMVGTIKNIDKLIEGGIASNNERISNGTHNFIGVMPWDNIRVQRNAESMKAWSYMHEIYDIWLSNDRCTYRKLSSIVKQKLSIDCRLEGMVNIFKNQQKYDTVVQSWDKEYNQ